MVIYLTYMQAVDDFNNSLNVKDCSFLVNDLRVYTLGFSSRILLMINRLECIYCLDLGMIACDLISLL